MEETMSESKLLDAVTGLGSTRAGHLVLGKLAGLERQRMRSQCNKSGESLTDRQTFGDLCKVLGSVMDRPTSRQGKWGDGSGLVGGKHARGC
jgi:hypothetical protein